MKKVQSFEELKNLILDGESQLFWTDKKSIEKLEKDILKLTSDQEFIEEDDDIDDLLNNI